MGRLRSGIHVLTGLWILAGLVVLGINGYTLASLFSAPLSGYSEGVRIVNGGLMQYRALLYAEAEKITEGMDLLATRFRPKVVEEEKQVPVTVSATRSPKKIPAPPPVVLPALTGIIMSRSTNGTIGRRALMEGRVCCEGDRVGDFTVKRISARGVSVVRDHRRWFIKVPEISYSLTTR
jgi:hypothetical protein